MKYAVSSSYERSDWRTYAEHEQTQRLNGSYKSERAPGPARDTRWQGQLIIDKISTSYRQLGSDPIS
ncbi:hypothetical protein MPTK1_3g11000 [Marchantia polymorpha subsp. ruderalis]|uniref:Uncharacterized protein n=2 Tax=Marchantia polymorpha TaxID=3197 RepID=A0AAF6AZJ8_MARPO|nr:hypothetical protein MARPO_0037s0096 [Marchantia polymorpha]BBN05182.1 hypothetical protein Mp_3g11000 [Marchantia polymorpha subsp. ruderalis]|eukprot:PTQ40922.1 hypothetical protein MARPO_0037s0096 [Marchantia polymorpha]